MDPEMKDLLASLVGKTQAEAEELIKEAGLHSRVSRMNGKACIGIRNYDRNRVNLEVLNGVIVDTHIG